MATDIPIPILVDFIIGDFQDAWDTLAARQGSLHRGNFLFARQAMTLLEVACRLCYSDDNGEALKDLSRELAQRDRRYFTQLPGSCWTPGGPPEFYLPSQSSNQQSELIAALFDLIRNGQAHQYLQIRARLTDSKDFQFALTGAEYGFPLSQTLSHGRPSDHLKAWKDTNSDLWIKVRTDVLFLDIRDAVHGARILNRGLTLHYLSRPRGSGSPDYKFSSVDLEAQLQNGGHFSDGNSC